MNNLVFFFFFFLSHRPYWHSTAQKSVRNPALTGQSGAFFFLSQLYCTTGGTREKVSSSIYSTKKNFFHFWQNHQCHLQARTGCQTDLLLSQKTIWTRAFQQEAPLISKGNENQTFSVTGKRATTIIIIIMNIIIKQKGPIFTHRLWQMTQKRKELQIEGAACKILPCSSFALPPSPELASELRWPVHRHTPWITRPPSSSG